MRQPHVLAIDLGTTGLKAAVVRVDGAVVALASRALTTVLSADGGVEQDADEWWRACIAAGREAVTESGVAADIRAVTCTSQFMSVVPVAADGAPVGSVVMWMDGRGADLTAGLRRREHVALWLERHGLAVFGSDDLTHIAFIAAHRPDVYAATAAFVEPADALTARLVGHVTANQNTAFPLLLIDNRKYGATTYDADLVARAGIDATKLPALVQMGAALGVVRPSVAKQLGIGADVVVLSGTMDTASGAAGTGAVDSERAGVVVGTTSVAVAHVTSMRADHARALMTAPSPIAPLHVVLAENGVGGKALEAVGGLLGASPADLIDIAATAPTGSNGVMFLPWLVGAMAPAPDGAARAGLLGLSLGSSRADIARAVLEGVAMNMAGLLPALESFVDSAFDEVTFGGGGAQSPLFAQILADVSGRAVHRVEAPRATNARGAALLAFVQLGLLDPDDIAAAVPIAATHEPNTGHGDLYGAALERFVAARSIAASL